MPIIAPTLQSDVYKQNHKDMYHPDVNEVYSNFTNRNGKYAPDNKLGGVVNVGLQYSIIDYLMDEFKSFFELPEDVAVKVHKQVMSAINGAEYKVSHLRALHKLGYLPLEIKALPEGDIVPYGVPSFTIKSTKKEFSWLTNGTETVISSENWPIQTAATTAANYKLNFMRAAVKTGIHPDLINWLGHDFSFRGMPGRQAASMTGFGHLSSFYGTDTIPAVLFAMKYYGADIDNEIIGGSVPATEHSVMCSWQNEGEIEAIRHLMKNFPTGILSIVSDTWDFWRLVTEYLPVLKDEIMSRDGKIVIRPDSGDPVEILCGKGSKFLQPKYWQDVMLEPEHYANGNDFHMYIEGDIYYVNVCDVVDFRNEYRHSYRHDNLKDLLANGLISPAGDVEDYPEWEQKGLIECLWDIFGGTVIDGYKHLDEHIGAIYGDSITLERQQEIICRLMDKGFAPAVVLGIGSFTYQYVTRDTHGSAIKATSVVKGDKREAIFKDPKTDPGKKSAKGLLMVNKDKEGNYYLVDDVTEEAEASDYNLLKTVWKDGEFVRKTTLAEIRARVDAQLQKLV